LEPSTCRVYFSRDVVFDETIFPFASLHANAGAQLKAKILLLNPTLRNNYGGDGVVLPNVPNSVDSLLESYVGPCTAEEEISSGDNPPMYQPIATNHGAEFGVASGAESVTASVLDRE
jgi:hypothetical protein